MFSIFRHKTPLKELMTDMYDVHSHLLPGVDDGCSSFEQSQRLIEELSLLGVKAIYCTPHIIADAYPLNNNAYLREKFTAFKSACSKRVDMRLAAEYLLDEKFVAHLDNEPLLMGNNHILVEFTMGAFTTNTFETLFEATSRGFTPIIAHPERYQFITPGEDMEILTHLIDAGCKLQLNLLSPTGWHGTMAQKVSTYLLDAELYDFVGSDIHSYPHLEAIQTLSISRNDAKRIERMKENNRELF